MTGGDHRCSGGSQDCQDVLLGLGANVSKVQQRPSSFQ